MNNTQERGSGLLIGVLVAALIGAAGVWYGFADKGNENAEAIESGSNRYADALNAAEETKNIMEHNTDGDAMTVEGETMMDSDMDGVMYDGAVLAGSSQRSPLLEFTQSDYQGALASGKLVVLYFYANWCPVCKAEFPKMQAAFDGLSSDQVVGFRVNFNDNETSDAEEALAREFGVAYQHTKVFVRSGERLLKSPESWDEARYETEISNVSG